MTQPNVSVQQRNTTLDVCKAVSAIMLLVHDFAHRKTELMKLDWKQLMLPALVDRMGQQKTAA